MKNPNKIKKLSLLAITGAAILFSQVVSVLHSQILLGTEGYTQNFDVLGANSKATLPEGWKADEFARNSDTGEGPYPVRKLGTYTDAQDKTRRRGGQNIGNNAGTYNFGAGDEVSATDRALGFYSNSNETSGTQSGNIYAWLVNDTGNTLTSLSVEYDVEKYRMGKTPAGYAFQLYYSYDGEAWVSGGVDFYTYFAPDDKNEGYENPPGDSVFVSGILSLSQSVGTGESVYLAWNHSVASGGESGLKAEVQYGQGLAIDNVFIAIPETSHFALFFGTGILLLMLGRSYCKK